MTGLHVFSTSNMTVTSYAQLLFQFEEPQQDARKWPTIL